MINVAQDDSTSQESWNEIAATRERDTDSDRPANPEVPDTPETSVTPGFPETPETSETSVIPEPPETPDSPATLETPKTPNTPINPNIVSGPSDFSNSDFIDFQESNSKMINVAQDDSTSEKNWNETATTRERDNDNSDHRQKNFKYDESLFTRAQLSLIRKRKIGDNSGLRSEPENVPGPSGHSEYGNINFQEIINAMFNFAQEDDNVGEENIDDRSTIRESDTVDSDRLTTSESSDSPYPLSPRKRRTLDNSGLHFTPGNVPGPSDSDEMIDVGQENIDERAIMTKRDTDDSDRPGTTSESSDSPYPLSPRKRRTLDYSGLAVIRPLRWIQNSIGLACTVYPCHNSSEYPL
ncbi:sporozoite surface protein 2-like [Cotesia glomerata]|uniref:sporozoite surface protein 2-like n=1 Tax=Cotesia glomerata TaxID=32391 RepID=UPI001D034D13|nr:sporozoite surface protein 2-like [Cotesia glomerata]